MFNGMDPINIFPDLVHFWQLNNKENLQKI